MRIDDALKWWTYPSSQPESSGCCCSGWSGVQISGAGGRTNGSVIVVVLRVVRRVEQLLVGDEQPGSKHPERCPDHRLVFAVSATACAVREVAHSVRACDV